ncbi:hypothetical protein CTRI78_v003047 [Colletotrichum trifolii]|uniref:Uncharacterized protein n=1 Tax=Colletotrichum trifolii TaxID=5466 RepID=A0A4V3HWY2_COLTR|nr:hypothetical protein CTRI78_v003047 [Colletotrichum trifolii]
MSYEDRPSLLASVNEKFAPNAEEDPELPRYSDVIRAVDVPGTPDMVEKRLLPLHDWKDLELERLSQFCLPPWDERTADRGCQMAIRPERPEFSTVLQTPLGQTPPNQVWMHTMQHIQNTILGGGMLESFLRDLPEEPATSSAGNTSPPSDSQLCRGNFQKVLGAVSIILYDKQLQQGPPATVKALDLSDRLKASAKLNSWRFTYDEWIEVSGLSAMVFQHMLLVDYGMEAPPVHLKIHGSDIKGEQRRIELLWTLLTTQGD